MVENVRVHHLMEGTVYCGEKGEKWQQNRTSMRLDGARKRLTDGNFFLSGCIGKVLANLLLGRGLFAHSRSFHSAQNLYLSVNPVPYCSSVLVHEMIF
jgi:hypothetical protein